MGAILAIDYGLKRVGLAISDPEKIFAFPCEVIENKNIDYLILQISNLILEKNVELILIGMPYSRGSENQRTRESEKTKVNNKKSMEHIVQDFVDKLKKSTNIPIKLVDERLSSFAANERLKEVGLSAKKSKKYIDSEAARLLLEEFLSGK